MDNRSSSFGTSMLEPILAGPAHSPINKNGMKSVSTPINDNPIIDDEGDLSEIQIDAFGKPGRVGFFNNDSNDSINNNSSPNKKLHSILKNSPNKIATSNGSDYQQIQQQSSELNDENSSTTLASVSNSLLRKHPSLRIATEDDGQLNPVKGARVIFSPTKQILSYKNEYLTDEDEDFTPSPQPHAMRNRIRKSSNLDTNRARVISSEGFYEEAEAHIEPQHPDDDVNEDDDFINLTNNNNNRDDNAFDNVLGSSFTNGANQNPNAYNHSSNPSSHSNNNYKDTFSPQSSFKNIQSGWASKALGRLVTDPRIPYVLSLYLQLVLNLLSVSLIVYLMFVFIKTVKSDVNQKIEMYTMDALHEISLCSREYYRNKCSLEPEDGGISKRAPALEKTCTMWGKCMNRDPQLIGKSKVTAETFADIINGFLKPISWKSLILMTAYVFFTFLFTNRAFGNYRDANFNDKHDDDAHTIQELEQKVREQEKLLTTYKDQLNQPYRPHESQNQNQRNRQNEPYFNTAAGRTPSFTRLESPHTFDNHAVVRQNAINNMNSSYHSPLQNKTRH